MSDRFSDDEFVQQLFDRMGATYAMTNLISSFGFSEVWRRACVRGAKIQEGSIVCDMMAGSGECWRHIPREVSRLYSIDFSNFMVNRQKERSKGYQGRVEVLNENATATSLGSGSIDHVVSAFGLKTLSEDAIDHFFRELERVLKPGGTFSLLEISRPDFLILRIPFEFYLCVVVPFLGRMLLGDIECYRMLGRYTKRFGSCAPLRRKLENAGFEASFRTHFFGCATSLTGSKPL